MSILSGVGQNAVDDVLKQIPGLEAFLEAWTKTHIQPTIDAIKADADGVKAAVASVKVDIDAVGKTVANVNSNLVPEMVKLVQSIEHIATRLDTAGRAFGAALSAK